MRRDFSYYGLCCCALCSGSEGKILVVDRRGGGVRLLNGTPVPRTLLTVNVPAVVKVLMGTLCGLISTCFIKKLKRDRVKTVSIICPLKRIIINLKLLFKGKTTSCVSELLKHGSGRGTGRIIDATLCDDIFIKTIVVVLSIVFLGPVLDVLKTARDVLPCTIACKDVCVVSYVFGIFGIAVGGVIADRKTTGAAVYTLLVKTMLGVTLSPVFVCMLSLKITKTTVTATVSRMMSALICLFCVFKGGDMFSFGVGGCYLSGRITSRVFGVNVPALIFRVLADLSVSLVGGTTTSCKSTTVTKVKIIAHLISVKDLAVFNFVGNFRPVTKCDCKTGGFGHLRRTVGASVV